MNNIAIQLRKQVNASLVDGRVDWADYAKGICIFLVVMMHAVLGVEHATGSKGWMHAFTTFAKPFRMPDFFMMSGLFLALTINVPWRRYIDRKVVHFAYFYLLWLALLTVLRAPMMISEGSSPVEILNLFVFSLVQPFGTLWFIYMLPIFLLTTRLLKDVRPAIMLAVTATLQVLPINTGSMIIDEFCALYFFFLFGYYFAPKLFDLANWAMAHPAKSIGILGVWVVINGAFTFSLICHLPFDISYPHVKWDSLPFVSLMLGLAGAIAIVMSAAVLTRIPWTRFIGYMGANSIVIYLAFTFPNSITRAVLLKFAPGLGVGTISLIVTLACVVGPLLMYYVICKTGYGRFLFERPEWARIDKPRKNSGENVSGNKLQPAE